MTRIAVASGKGGTGKTLLATSLAYLLAEQGRDVTYVDADVEEPNGHLFLGPDIQESRRFVQPIPTLAGQTCSGCGECQEACAFNAIIALPDSVMVFPELCHSCGGCLMACPERLLVEEPREMGTIARGEAATPGGPIRFVSGTLDVGEARATPLVSGMLETVADRGTVIIDAPPGTSCTAMAAIEDADLVVLVTEPTPFGLHDLELAAGMARALGRDRIVAVINRADLGASDPTRAFLEAAQIEVVAEIPFSREVAKAYARGRVAAAESPTFRGLLSPLTEPGLISGEVSP